MQVAANQRTYHSNIAAYSAALNDDLVLTALTAGMKERQRRRSLVEKDANDIGWGKSDMDDRDSMDRSVGSPTLASAGSTTLLTAQLQVQRDGRQSRTAPGPASPNPAGRKIGETKASR